MKPLKHFAILLPLLVTFVKATPFIGKHIQATKHDTDFFVARALNIKKD